MIYGLLINDVVDKITLGFNNLQRDVHLESGNSLIVKQFLDKENLGHQTFIKDFVCVELFKGIQQLGALLKLLQLRQWKRAKNAAVWQSASGIKLVFFNRQRARLVGTSEPGVL